MKRLIAALILLFVLVFSSSFVVPQGNYALVYDLWHSPAHPTLVNAGLHFKWPFFQKIALETAQPQLLVADGSHPQDLVAAQTFDQHHVDVGYTLIWQVTDPLKFYQASLNADPATHLRTQLNSAITQEISALTLAQLLQLDAQQTLIHHSLDKMNRISAQSGIQCLALLLTSITMSDSEKTAWVAHIQKQQQAALEDLRQKTAVLSQTLQADTDKKAIETIANAETQANQIRAKASQEATQIYANAYNKDPDFYEFYHNLQMYKKILSNKQDILVLGTDTPFFKSIDAPKK